MANHANYSSSLLRLLLLTLIVAGIELAAGGKRSVQIPDELDDVVDDEEDEAWKEWGKRSAPPTKFDPPPTDFSGMDLSEIQAEMLKRHSGPAFGFVKLRLGVRRSPDMVAEIAMKWTKVLRTGAIEANFMGVDISTVMFTMEKGQDITELKEFILNEPEAYEVKIGDQVFRRPGDPPLEEVVEMLDKEKNKEKSDSPRKENGHPKEEL